MPVFGKSLFEAVLAGLDRQEEDDEDEVPPQIRGFNGGFVGRDMGHHDRVDMDPSVLFESYEPDPEVLTHVVPVWLDRLSDAEIVDDLDLASCRNEQDFRERRRVFALENHPDRVSVDYRAQATRRMMVANQLLDAALARHIRN